MVKFLLALCVSLFIGLASCTTTPNKSGEVVNDSIPAIEQVDSIPTDSVVVDSVLVSTGDSI